MRNSGGTTINNIQIQTTGTITRGIRLPLYLIGIMWMQATKTQLSVYDIYLPLLMYYIIFSFCMKEKRIQIR